MLQKVLFIITVILALVGTVPSAYAHSLKTDDSIGAVLHIDPDDAPIARTLSTFFFEVKDKQNKFSGHNCTCILTIEGEGRSTANVPLTVASDNPTTLIANHLFSEPGAYTLTVSGSPNKENAFAPFTLTYTIRVEAASGGGSRIGSTFVHTIHYGAIALASLYVIGVILKENRKASKAKQKEKK